MTESARARVVTPREKIRARIEQLRAIEARSDAENTELERLRITGQIIDLREKTVENGASEAEAIIAAATADRLEAKYRLTQSDFDVASEPIDLHSVKRRQRLKPVVEDYCLSGIRKLCGVKAWFELHGNTRVLILFGQERDREWAEWLYKMIGNTIMSDAERFKKDSKGDHYGLAAQRQAVTDFRRGMAHRINERLLEMAEGQDAKTGSGTALVVVRNPLVDDAYAKLTGNWNWGKVPKGRRVTYSGSYSQGRVAGEKVTLNRPLTGPSAPKGYIN